MIRATPRQIEYFYFEQFRKHYSLPESSVEYDDKPDVRLKGERLLGIELARLYLKDGTDSSSEQVQSARRTQVLARAQALHTDHGGRPIELWVDFDPAKPIVDVETSAQRLATLAKEFPPGPVQLVGELSGNAEGLRYVYCNGLEYPDAQWRAQQVFTVPNLDTSRLRAVVTEKSGKVCNYMPCDEYWLLLIVDFMDPAQDQELVLPADFRLGKGPFDKILLYKPPFGQVVEVPQ